MSDTIQTMADFVSETSYVDLPDDIVRTVKLLLPDSMGYSLASISTDRGKMSIGMARKSETRHPSGVAEK